MIIDNLIKYISIFTIGLGITLMVLSIGIMCIKNMNQNSTCLSTKITLSSGEIIEFTNVKIGISFGVLDVNSKNLSYKSSDWKKLEIIHYMYTEEEKLQIESTQIETGSEWPGIIIEK